MTFYRIKLNMPSNHPSNLDGYRRDAEFFVAAEDLDRVIDAMRKAEIQFGASPCIINQPFEVEREVKKWMGVR